MYFRCPLVYLTLVLLLVVAGCDGPPEATSVQSTDRDAAANQRHADHLSAAPQNNPLENNSTSSQHGSEAKSAESKTATIPVSVNVGASKQKQQEASDGLQLRPPKNGDTD